jgi:copper(I)-binding protein
MTGAAPDHGRDDVTRRSPWARSRRTALAAAVSLAVLGGALGCSEPTPTETPGAEVTGGAIGPDESVSPDVKVLQVQLEFPVDGVYEVGEDAGLHLAVSNTGPDPDTLVDVSGPDFTGVRTARADGGTTQAIEVPADATVYIGAQDGPSVVLVGLTRELRSSVSIPVTFTFARAGTVTVDAMVAAAGGSGRLRG